MNEFPDFSCHGYKVVRELGNNRAGGRVTYLATRTSIIPPNIGGELVVIKQFQFVQTDSNWSDYEACDREIKLLQQLNHPNIPRYLDSFETSTGFCIVQEYKQASSLAQIQQWTREEIKQIACAVLEVLVYLQQQLPPVIHRDIKPENILVDRQEKVKIYLVDFGFASTGGGEVAISSAVKGTLGFMPPEQLFNRELTEASDLYSLGATLICLLTKTKSSAIGSLLDDTYRFKFKKLVPNLERQFIDWLEKMVSPNPKQRFDNAAAALKALKRLKIQDSSVIKAEKPVISKKSRKVATVLGITALTCVTLYSTTVAFFTTRQNQSFQYEIASLRNQQQAFYRSLWQTNQCVECDLSGANLKGAKLNHANLKLATLERTDLRGAHLSSANLNGAKLRSAKLGNAYLDGSDLGYANLENANLWKASLSSANLQNANLQRVDLRGANLGYANLGNAKLRNANLGYANLIGANLIGANLIGTNLMGANLQNANLKGVNIKSADLRSAKLNWANLGNAKLERVKLTDAELIGADLQSADLENAKLAGARLKGAKLLIASLKDADLAEANLEGADLRGANLRGANLKSAYLRGANLQGANLQGANIEGANLRDANLKDATMPNGKVHP